MSVNRRLLPIISMIVILTIIFSGFPMRSRFRPGERWSQRQVNAQTGKLSFIGPEMVARFLPLKHWE